MTISKQLVLPVLVMVAGFGVFASAQAKKPAAKTPAAKVFFIEPKNGATVTSPVHMKFGSSGIEISAVPAGDVKTARPGHGALPRRRRRQLSARRERTSSRARRRGSTSATASRRSTCS